MTMELKDKTAVITGGASGIGLAMARRLGNEGMRIVLADVERQALEAATAELKAAGVAVVGVPTDVTRYADLEALEAQAAAAFGKTHLLCNNAGVSITGPTAKLSLDDWTWVWDVNVRGVVHGIKAFLPGMLAHGEPGHIVNTGSLASFKGIGNHAPYCSSKAAVLGLSQSLYSELRATMANIGVSILCPGMVDTRIHQSWRNRPAQHVPWSDREFNDADVMMRSNQVQGAGIAATVVADKVVEAVYAGRFYIFTNEGSQRYVAGTAGRAALAEDPFVVTWGEDRRPESERGVAPWAA